LKQHQREEVRLKCELFKNDCINLVDKHQPSRQVEAATPDTVQHVNGLIQENGQITFNEMWVEMTLAMGLLTPVHK
jgi:hypothetical protein